MIGILLSNSEIRRRATPVLRAEASCIRGCRYTLCIVEERALYGAVALILIYKEEFEERRYQTTHFPCAYFSFRVSSSPLDLMSQ